MINETQKVSPAGIMPPDLREFMQRIKREIKSEIFKVAPGTIVAFDKDSQTASVKLDYKAVIIGGIPQSNGTAMDKIVDYPIILKCPVMVLTGGQARLTMPVAAGDTCIILFCDRDIDDWYQTGDINRPPATARMHDISDALAIVGIRSIANQLADFNAIIASLVDLHGERLAQTGDIKDSIRTTDHSGWIMMKGDTVGKATGTYQGEQYRDLFNFLKAVAPNTGSEDFDAGATVVIPDQRGRGRVTADNMGGTPAGVLTNTYTPNRNTLGGHIGEEAHALTVPELPAHHHEYSTWGSTGSSGPISLNDRCPWTTYNTADTGQNVPHNTVQPGLIFNTFIKI